MSIRRSLRPVLANVHLRFVLVALAPLAILGTAGTATVVASAGQSTEPRVVQQLEAEIEAVEEDDPAQAEVLQRDLDAIERHLDVDVEAGGDGGGDAGDTPPSTAPGPAYDAGEVECEPYPGLLTAAELAGARCVTVPQPDGSAAGVAITPSGVTHVVRLDDSSSGGEAERLADTSAPLPGNLGDLALAVTPAGHVLLTGPDGRTEELVPPTSPST